MRVSIPDEIKAFGEYVGKAVGLLPTYLHITAEIEDMVRNLQ